MLTNKTGISLTLAVWLAHDEYDYVNDPLYISATSLMKPLRQIVLPRRVPVEQREAPDVSEMVAQAMGHSLHDSIEKAWVKGYANNLNKLGYPPSVIERVRINPTPEQAKDPKIIPIYLEQRAIKELDGHKIGGKFDFVAEGHVEDQKSTSAFVWVKGTRDDEHSLQGSIYRWLNPEIITEDFIRINYIFTDWMKAKVAQNPAYPPQRVMSKDVLLKSIPETEKWISAKLALIRQHINTPEHLLPKCTDEELWRSDPEFKYYADPTKTSGCSTKNFEDMVEARKYHAEKGGKGVIKIIPGEVKRCNYCAAFKACTQKDEYFP